MTKGKKESFFWTSYSDLMTSLFFVMLVLFILTIALLYQRMSGLQVTIERLNQVLELESQFRELSNATSLDYDDKNKFFYARAFTGIEIFQPNSDIIKQEYIATVDTVGNDLENILKDLSGNGFHYQLVIEGTAAIPWEQLQGHNYNPDNYQMYILSYRRALALYNRWSSHNLRRYNTEVIIAGSGFNGINRDMQVEDNNKRFVIQIIPKINRPVSAIKDF